MLTLVLYLAAAPFNQVKNPTADPSPWRGDEVFELQLEAEGTSGGAPPARWSYQAVATLVVRKTAHGFTLTMRGKKWWSGSGQDACRIEGLVHAQDQDVTTDANGSVRKLTLHPPPRRMPELGDCPHPEKRQEIAGSLWSTLAMLSGAAKQEKFSQKRLAMPHLGPDVFMDLEVNHARPACISREITCRQGIIRGRFRGERTPVDRTVTENLTIDPEGRPRYFHRRQHDAAPRSTVELSIIFRTPGARKAPPGPRPTGR